MSGGAGVWIRFALLCGLLRLCVLCDGPDCGYRLRSLPQLLGIPNMTLASLGWNDGFAAAFQPFSNDGFLPARVALEHKHAYELLSPQGEIAAE